MPAPPTPSDRVANPAAGGDWLAVQRASNLTRFDAWEASASHRDRVTAEIARGFSPEAEPRLCLLGVGPAVDVDLPTLLETFSEVVAADLDAATLGEGLRRQGVGEDPRVRAAGGVDLLPTAGDPHEGAAAGDYLASLAERRLPTEIGAGFDAAASLTTLTQLIDQVVHAVGSENPSLPDFAAAVRAGHLRTLAGLLRPGGVGLLVCDLFSDVTCPALADAADAEMPDLVRRELARGNVFHGVHPDGLLRSLRTDVPGVGPTQLLKPWVWRTVHRRYAVTAVKFRLLESAGA